MTIADQPETSAKIKLDCLSIDIELEETKLAKTKVKQRLAKNPMCDDGKLSAIIAKIEALKQKKKAYSEKLKVVKKKEEKESMAFLEARRKEELFEIFQSIILEDHVCAIPELFNTMDHWINVYWWDLQEKKWVSSKSVVVVDNKIIPDEPIKNKKNTHLFDKLQYILEQRQYLCDNHDINEFNAYIQHHNAVPRVIWNQYLLFNNGILINGTIVENKFNYFTFDGYPFSFLSIEDLGNRADLGFLVDRFSQVTTVWEELCWWIGCALRHLPMEYFYFFLGQPSGGKSPWAHAIKDIFGKVGTDALDTLGDKGGLNTSWDKWINIDFDANIAYLPNAAIAKIKQIYGDDPMQNVRLLYQNSFQVKISPYMIVCTNNMPKINQGINTSAVFKRARIAEFNQQLKDDKEFKNMLQDQEFLDLFGSFCYWKSFDEDLADGSKCNRRAGRLPEFIAETEKAWMDSAYTVRKAVLFLLRRSTNPDDEILCRQLTVVVQAWFRSKDHNILCVAIPTNILGEITEAVGLLGGDRCIRNKQKVYEGVWWTKEGTAFLEEVRKHRHEEEAAIAKEESQAVLERCVMVPPEDWSKDLPPEPPEEMK